MDWRTKGTIQKLLGLIPGGRSVHYQLQRHFGGLSNPEKECHERLEEWTKLMGGLAKFGASVRGAALMELGTGYYPALPLCMYLAGAKSIITIDLTRHLRSDLTVMSAQLIEREASRIWPVTGAPRVDFDRRLDGLAARLQAGASLPDATGGCVVYSSPADARTTGLPGGSIDIVFSNNVLEHLPPDAISACWAEALRILRPGGIVAHQIDCGDHYADTDRRIGKYNFLQYTHRRWSFWNNRFLYQNRLRAVDFRSLAAECGFDDVSVLATPPREEEWRELRAMRLAPCFAQYTLDELSITHFCLIARRSADTLGPQCHRARQRPLVSDGVS